MRVSFGDAIQVFNIGAASVGTLRDAGRRVRGRRGGSGGWRSSGWSRRRPGWPATGCELNAAQAYIIEILGGIVTSTPESAALFAPEGELLRAGDGCASPSWPTRSSGSGAEGSRPFYEGDIGAAIVDWVTERGGLLTRADLAAYRVVDREPVRVGYRGREVLTNPPPSAGGILIARALALLDAEPGPPTRDPAGGGDGAHPARAHARVPRRASTIPSSWSASWRRRSRGGPGRSAGGWARPRTSRRSTARAGRAR